MHGGKRNGAGRPKGAISLRTRALIEAAQCGNGEMPIAYMLRVMRDDQAPNARRDRMAKAAAAYLYSRLSVVEGEDDNEPDALSEPVAERAGDDAGGS